MSKRNLLITSAIRGQMALLVAGGAPVTGGGGGSPSVGPIIASLALSDVNFGSLSNGAENEPSTFNDDGSLGGTWDNLTNTNHKVNINTTNNIYRGAMDGRESDGDTSHIQPTTTGSYFDTAPICDVFMIIKAGTAGLSPNLMRYSSNPDFVASKIATAVSNAVGTTVNGNNAENASDAYTLINNQGAVIVRVPNADLTGGYPRFGCRTSSQYPRNGEIIRWSAVPSSVVPANLSAILAELQETVDIYNGDLTKHPNGDFSAGDLGWKLDASMGGFSGSGDLIVGDGELTLQCTGGTAVWLLPDDGIKVTPGREYDVTFTIEEASQAGYKAVGWWDTSDTSSFLPTPLLAVDGNGTFPQAHTVRITPGSSSIMIGAQVNVGGSLTFSELQITEAPV